MQSGDTVYYADFTEGIKEFIFVESWEMAHSYIRDGRESYQVPDDRLFATRELAKEFIRKKKRLRITSIDDRIKIVNILQESNPKRYSINNQDSIFNMVLDIAKLEGIGFHDIESIAASIGISDIKKFVSKLEKYLI